MKYYSQELQLKELVSYITGKHFTIKLILLLDYMRLVIENGKQFTNDNFFMMLQEINPHYLDESASRFLMIMLEEL